MHAGVCRFNQYGQSSVLQLFFCHFVVPGVWRIEARIDVTHQGVTRVRNVVAVNTPLLAPHARTINTVNVFDDRVCREAGAQDRRDVLICPADHAHQGVPEGFFFQCRVRHIGAGDDQGIEALFL